jgi:DNA-binding transcriptional regulator YdaS (Cro superfamily)
MKPRRPPPKTPFDRAVRKHGLRTADIAYWLGVSPQCVQNWRSGRNHIKPSYAKTISKKFRVPLHEIRPDVWPRPRVRPVEAPQLPAAPAGE